VGKGVTEGVAAEKKVPRTSASGESRVNRRTKEMSLKRGEKPAEEKKEEE